MGLRGRRCWRKNGREIRVKELRGKKRRRRELRGGRKRGEGCISGSASRAQGVQGKKKKMIPTSSYFKKNLIKIRGRKSKNEGIVRTQTDRMGQ